jgi:DNA polymerase-4
VASDLGKPDGLLIVPRGRGPEFLAKLPLRRLWGVGPRTAEKLQAIGLRVIGDLQRLEESFLARHLGDSSGRHLHRLARGLDLRPVDSTRTAKSISTESTFSDDLRDPSAIEDFLFTASTEVARSLRKDDWLARTAELKVRTGSFRTWTRSRVLLRPTDLAEDLYQAARTLFATRIDLGGEGVRLLGVGASGLVRGGLPQQETLFAPSQREAAAQSERLVDRIIAEQGRDAIGPARLLLRGARKGDRDRPERQRPSHSEGDRRAPPPPSDPR